MKGFGDFGKDLPRHKKSCTCVQCCQKGVRILDHQGFYAVTFKTNGSANNLAETLAQELKALADWVRQQNGLIGHIKAAISGDDQNVTLSITKDVVRYQGQWDGLNPAEVNFAAIVTGVDREHLKQRVEHIYQAIGGGTP